MRSESPGPAAVPSIPGGIRRARKGLREHRADSTLPAFASLVRSARFAAGCSAIASLALALPAAARAQEPADTFRLEELVVTATRVPVPRDAVPAAVHVITGEELRARGIRTVADALRALPGATVARTGSYGGTTSLFLRGGESDYVQVLVDGIPVNEPGGSFDFAALTTENVERIEVVRGPASVLYGSDAVTGVVQVFTRGGSGPARAGAAVRTGSYGTRAFEAGLAGGGDAVGYSLAVSRLDTDGIYAFNSDYRRTAASGQARWTPGTGTEARLTLRYSDGEYHYPTDYKGDPVDRNAYQLDERMTAGLELARRLGSRLDLRLLLSTDRLEADIDDRPDDASDPDSYRSHRTLDRRAVDLRADLRLAGGTVLTGGIEIERQEEESWNRSTSAWGESSGSMAVDRSNRAAYAQLLADVRPRLSLTAGARAEDNSAFGSFATWRAGAAYRLGGATRLRAAAGTAFKEPTFIENFAEGFARGNPDLDPERSTSLEAGFEHGLAGGRAWLAATWFHQRFRDQIQYTYEAPGPEAPNFFNIGAATASGIEVEGRLAPAPGLALEAGYTFLDGEVTEPGYADPELFPPGSRLLRRPAHDARLALLAGNAGRATLRLEARYVGERDDLDFSAFPARRVALDAYTRVDAAARLRVLAPRGRRPAVTATVRVENLLDAGYQEVRHFPAPGRAVFLGVQVGTGL